MKKIFVYKIAVIAVLLAALILSNGCSAGKNDTSTGASTAGTSVQTTPEPSPADISSTVTPKAVPSPENTPTPSVAPVTPAAEIKTTPSPASEKPKAKKSVPILYYHAINDNITGIEELFVSPGEFEKQMEFLKKNNYTVITFDQLERLEGVENPVIITLDDGYEDNYLYAYPILKKYNYKATIFLCSGFIDNPSILKTSQIKEMTDLINFQGHSITHPDLRTLSREEVERELSESKKAIEALTGTPVTVFAYPTGYYDRKTLEITQKYYKYAVLNGGGIYTEGDNNYEIRRVYVPRNLDIAGFEKKIKGLK